MSCDGCTRLGAQRSEGGHQLVVPLRTDEQDVRISKMKGLIGWVMLMREYGLVRDKDRPSPSILILW